MKAFLSVSLFLFSCAGFAAEGTVVTEINPARPEMLGISIHGEAADEISKALADANIETYRDPFSNQLVQYGQGIRCIKKAASAQPYCYVGVENGAVQ